MLTTCALSPVILNALLHCALILLPFHHVVAAATFGHVAVHVVRLQPGQSSMQPDLTTRERKLCSLALWLSVLQVSTCPAAVRSDSARSCQPGKTHHPTGPNRPIAHGRLGLRIVPGAAGHIACLMFSCAIRSERSVAAVANAYTSTLSLHDCLIR